MITVLQGHDSLNKEDGCSRPRDPPPTSSACCAALDDHVVNVCWDALHSPSDRQRSSGSLGPR